MVCFSRLASPSHECILDSLPLMDLLRSVFLCRHLAFDQVPAALRRRRHLKLLICPSTPSGLRLWATIPIDPLAIYRIRDLQQRQRQPGYEWDSKPGDDGSIRGHNILVLTQLQPSTTHGLLDAFPLIISLTFVQCAVSVATTVQLIVLLKSAWSSHLVTLKLYLNQYPELGPIRTDSIMEEDILLWNNKMARSGAGTRHIGPYRPGIPVDFRLGTEGDRIRFWQREAVKTGCELNVIFSRFQQAERIIWPVLGTLWGLFAEGTSSPFTCLRSLTLHTDVARYGAFGCPAVLYQNLVGNDALLFGVIPKVNNGREQFHLRPLDSIRHLTIHFDQVDHYRQFEVRRLLEAQLDILETSPTLGSISLTTPIGIRYFHAHLLPAKRQLTRRFTALALFDQLPGTKVHWCNLTMKRVRESFSDYFTNLRSLSLLALRPNNLATFLGQCSRLCHLRHLTITWSNLPSLRLPRTVLPPSMPVLGTLTSLTLYYLGAITNGHDALQPLLSHWAVTGPAFPGVTTFAFHVIGDYQCNHCPIQEGNPASSCKRLLADSLAVHAPVLKTFKMISQWEEKIGKHEGESDAETDPKAKGYDLPQTVTRYNYTEITDF